MLNAARFKGAPMQAKFLALVVKRALKGQRSTEEIIGKMLIPGFEKDENTDVRVTALNLRKNLKKYFEGEGSDDPVIISLPEPPEDRSLRPPGGKAYTPSFSYHPHQAVSFQYRLADALLSKDSVGQSKAALHKFGDVLELAPHHIGAALGMAEAWCCLLYWLKSSVDKSYVEETSLEAGQLLDKTLQISPKYWRTHAVKGFLLAEMDALDLARQSFSVALSLSRASTESYPPYIQFLIASGEKALGLRLAERYIEPRLKDQNACIAYADILLRAEEYNAASQALEVTLELHGHFGLVHHRLFLMRLVQKRVDDALTHGNSMIHFLDPISVEATVDLAKRLVEFWPENERQAFHDRMALEQRREEATAKAISRVRKSLKA